MRENRQLLFRDLPLVEADADGDLLDVPPILYYCRACGDAYAKLAGAGNWTAVAGLCEHHGSPSPRYGIGGSLLLPLEWWASALSQPGALGRFLLKHPKLLSHEFHMHFAWAEKYPPSPLTSWST